jgi:hypothetical protein
MLSPDSQGKSAKEQFPLNFARVAFASHNSRMSWLAAGKDFCVLENTVQVDAKQQDRILDPVGDEAHDRSPVQPELAAQPASRRTF